MKSIVALTQEPGGAVSDDYRIDSRWVSTQGSKLPRMKVLTRRWNMESTRFSSSSSDLHLRHRAISSVICRATPVFRVNTDDPDHGHAFGD